MEIKVHELENIKEIMKEEEVIFFFEHMFGEREKHLRSLVLGSDRIYNLSTTGENGLDIINNIYFSKAYDLLDMMYDIEYHDGGGLLRSIYDVVSSEVGNSSSYIGIRKVMQKLNLKGNTMKENEDLLSLDPSKIGFNGEFNIETKEGISVKQEISNIFYIDVEFKFKNGFTTNSITRFVGKNFKIDMDSIINKCDPGVLIDEIEEGVVVNLSQEIFREVKMKGFDNPFYSDIISMPIKELLIAVDMIKKSRKI